MFVLNHLLCQDDGIPVPFKKSPNISMGIQPEYIVIHYTGGPTVSAAVSTLTSKSAQVSSHLVIGRDGSIVQLVPFNRVAWHAGVSTWEGRNGLNSYTFGIELDNNGQLNQIGGKWTSPFKHVISDDQVIVARHKAGRKTFGWQTYTDAQLAAAVAACRALFVAYGLRGVVGHDEIAPLRKFDPGPAFAIDDFLAHVNDGLVYEPAVYTTISKVSLRDAPGYLGKPVIPGMLPKGTRLNRFEIQNYWMHVRVLDEVGGITGLDGWVYARYVQPLST